MSSRRFFNIFIILTIVAFAAIAILNMVVSPFGLFGDKLMDWYSYNMTQNPRIAKIEYLDGKDEFDSFVVGASGSAAFPTKELNEYTGGNFYNTFYYGADMKDSVDTVKYLIDNYEVKNIFLPVGFAFASSYDVGNDTLNNTMHYKVDGSNPLTFYGKYLFANPNYMIDKIQSKSEDSIIQKSFDVFYVEDGSYDKFLRDVEPISDIESYLAKDEYKQFASGSGRDRSLGYIDEFVASMEEIVQITDKNNIDLTVLVSPLYHDDYQYYDVDEVEEFYTRLADVVPYWDFTKSSVSYEPRYFYDRTHWRNDVGTMMLARVFGNEEAYLPDDFGIYVDGDATLAMKRYEEDIVVDENEYTQEVSVLMYHHIADEGDGGSTISEEAFICQMESIAAEGYNTVSMEDLINYVDYGIDLPEKALVITFDDGYSSNYEIAYPIMEELGLKGTVFPIGHSVGLDEYKDTGEKIIPHFTIEEAREMNHILELGSHTYDMHQAEHLEEGDKVRKNVKRLEDDTEEEYIDDFLADFHKIDNMVQRANGEGTTAFAYPTGAYDDLAAILLSQQGVRVTFLTEEKGNVLIKGLKQSLYGLGRYNMTD